MKLHRLLFFLLLALLPTQLGYHFWPEWALVLGRRVDYLAPTLYVTDILVLFTVGSWFIQNKLKVQNPKVKSNPKSKIPISLFLLFVFSNILFAANLPVAFYAWIKVLEYALLGFYIIKTKPAFFSVIFFLSIGVFYSSVIAIVQFVLQHSIGGPLWWLGERTFTGQTPGIAQFPLRLDLGFRTLDLGLKLRPYATFPHPNVLGGYLAAILPPALWQSSKIKTQNSKFFYGATIILGIAALALTFSRSAWAVGGVGLLVVGYWLLVKKKIIQWLVFGCATLLLLASILSLQNISSESESVAVRRELTTTALRTWQQSPLVGVGLGNFLVTLPQHLPSRTIYFLQPVHNIYLLVLAETGGAGLVIFLFLLMRPLRQETGDKRQIGKRSHQEIIVPVAYRLSVVAVLALGLVDHYPLTLQQGQLLLTLFVALVFASRSSHYS